MPNATPDHEPAQLDDAPGVAIRIRDVRVIRGGSTALRIDALDIEPGVTALVGPNGSGKSTLLHAIAGLLPLATGTVDISGTRGDSSNRVAYVLQTQPAAAHLLVTAREVVALGRSADRGPFARLHRTDHDLIDLAMERVSIRELGRRHLAELSGGQRQRVFVAQGLAQAAEVLLLDEPVAGLDMTSAQSIRRIIDAERDAGRTVVVATHDLREASSADHVVLLDKTVVVCGPPQNALTSANLRRAYGGRVLDLGDEVIAVDDGVHHGDPDHEHHSGRSGLDEHGRHPERHGDV